MNRFSRVVAGAALAMLSLAAAAGDGPQCKDSPLVSYAADRIRGELRASLGPTARVQLAELRSTLATQMALGGAQNGSPTMKSGS